ncbi:MAG: hypothetical protein PF542_04725 [Nanoarchaeota archaeon]|jgi:hypothetical protein|nr:hypothetical protein [Nanoarchaeota archaeon]
MEIIWSKNCLKDIGSEKEFLKVKACLERSFDNLFVRTKQIGSIGRNVRRLRFWDKRLFLFFKGDILFCIAYLDRKNAYKKITINNLKSLIGKILEKGL